MRWFAIVAAFATGLVFGAVPFLINSGSVAAGTKRAADLDGLSTGELGSILMSRVGQRFTRDSRREYPLGAGVAFFDVPKPYRDSLCRVDRFEISPNMVNDQRVQGHRYWDDNLKLTRFYFAWKQLDSTQATVAQREKACAEHKDFNNILNEGTPYAAGRAFHLMNVATTQASHDKVEFSLTCNFAEQAECLALLRSIKLRALRHVRSKSEVVSDGTASHTDEITVVRPEKSPGRWMLRVTATSRAVAGYTLDGGHELLALRIEEMPPLYTPTAP